MEECEIRQGFIWKWGPLMVLSLSLAIILIDVTLLNVALSAIVVDLKTNIQQIQWVITAYSLTIAALIITGGRVGDIFGRKKMFMLGAVLFAGGSFLASISHNIPTLVAGESIIEGIGAALMLPATTSLLVSTYKGKDRAIAFGVWGGVAAASTAIGPLLGGYLTSSFSWRWGFRINLFVAAVLLIGSVLIRECRAEGERPNMDWLAVVLSSFGMFAVVFAVIESSTYGWLRAKKPFQAFGTSMNLGGLSICFYALLAGVLLLVAFIFWERHYEASGRTPLVSIGLFTNRQYTSGTLTATVLAFGQTGLIFSVPVFLQAVRGENAFHTGLALLPMSVAALIAGMASGFLAGRVPLKRSIQLGALLFGVGFVVLYFTLTVTSTAWDMFVGLALIGAGMGLALAQVSNLTISAVDVSQAGEASGVSSAFRQLGSSLGTAVVGAVILTVIASGMIAGIEKSKSIPPALKPALKKVLSQQSSSIEFTGSKTSGNLTPAVQKEIKSVVDTATTKANRRAMAYAAIIGFLAFIVSFWLPNEPKEEEAGGSTAAETTGLPGGGEPAEEEA